MSSYHLSYFFCKLTQNYSYLQIYHQKKIREKEDKLLLLQRFPPKHHLISQLFRNFAEELRSNKVKTNKIEIETMLQRDYIQRLIREFMSALERMLEKKEVEVRKEKIKELYEQYVGPYAFYRTATIDDVMKAMAGIDDEEKRLSKMDMLAELYFHEADLESKPFRDDLLEKAFRLFDYVETHGNTFSIERRNKMRLIRQNL